MADELEDKIKFLAERAFDTGAIRINLDEPFVTNNKTQVPISSHLGFMLEYPSDRKLCADAMERIITQRVGRFDAVCSTTTLGLMQASAFARKFSYPLFALNGNESYEINYNGFNLESPGDVNYIVSGSRLATPYSTFVADSLGLKLSYIKARDGEKANGGRKLPHPAKEDKVLLVVSDEDQECVDDTLSSVRDEFDKRREMNVSEKTLRVDDFIKKADVMGKRILIFGALFDYDGYFSADFKHYKDAGAKDITSVHLVGYGLADSNLAMRKIGCINRNVLGLDYLADVAFNTGRINSEERRRLIDWRKNPSRWGAKYGFPRVNSKTA
ncbi:MAG: hypothetical protein AABX35_01995 [Nanoarchaeota archaeon]